MPPTNVWWVPLVQQYPVAAVAIVSIWGTLRWAHARTQEATAREAARVDEAFQRADAEVARAGRSRTAETGRHTSELERLQKQYAIHYNHQRARVRDLERQLDRRNS